jgi:hypothetical protein
MANHTVADGRARQEVSVLTGPTLEIELANTVLVDSVAFPGDPDPVTTAGSELTVELEVFADTPFTIDATANPGFGFGTRFVLRLAGPTGDLVAYDETLDRFSTTPQTITIEGSLPEGAYTLSASASFDLTGDASGEANLLGTLTVGDPPGACSRADLASPLGVLDLADIVSFVTLFIAQDPRADLILNGVWDLDDINDFVGAFIAGCP